MKPLDYGSFCASIDALAPKGSRMIRIHLKSLLADREFQSGRRITLEEMASATGIHRTTLSKIANQRGYNTTTDNIDKICAFLRCSVGELLEHIPDETQR